MAYPLLFVVIDINNKERICLSADAFLRKTYLKITYFFEKFLGGILE